MGPWASQTPAQPPSDLVLLRPGLGELPFLFRSGISAHHADDDGRVVHHVVQVRGPVGECAAQTPCDPPSSIPQSDKRVFRAERC